MFHSLEEAQDLNQDGVVDEREKAIATETENKKKRAPRKKKEVTE
ncbi:hypothetical protein PYDG_00001 [Pseudoalteromonas phage pYD6-A]|uniref:Uncharacterized protein n=1 Tax=Pseudoalteromonas phage pYD6-A TaxID=754052 RepID=M4SNB5_9CAUD|nr:hypothetical protein PYDG_00001 [Pseudoalteromonas phage pYD6-A]AGH57533.1 hypothetical protein PYDG_00001 [Pseudoalteromonas phage pYD6-A]